MSKYVPKFHKEDRDLLVLDNLFAVEDCVDYASRHNMDVLLTVTTSASSVEAMMQFKKQGYSIDLIEKEMRAPDWTKISSDIYVLFTRDGNTSEVKEEDETKEEKNAFSSGLIDKANENISTLIDKLVSKEIINLGNNCPYQNLSADLCFCIPANIDDSDSCADCRKQWAEREREKLLKKYSVNPESRD